MQRIKVKKDILLKKLKQNRNNHRNMFLKAQEGYRQTVIEHLEEMLEDARNNKRVNTYVDLESPTDQTKDYDRAIQMLEMDVDKTVELSANEFSNYVMDDWSWKEQFIASNMNYITKVGRRK